MIMNKYFLLCAFLFLGIAAMSQQDSIVLVNDDNIVGEIKGMQRGILKIETEYSDKDFVIEWSGVKLIYSQTYFLITLSYGRRYNGKISSVDESKVKIYIQDDGETIVDIKEIVYLEKVDKGDVFWSRVSAAVDMGIDITKANNLRQFAVRSNAKYVAERWSLKMFYNAIKTRQDSVAPVNRDDGGIDFKYYFERKWYGIASINFLSNTEQKIDLRSTGRLGGGTYIIQTNHVYWTVSVGVSFNEERYENPVDNRESLEVFMGSEINMFDTGDLSLDYIIGAYPSMTESGRWRFDSDLDLKHDLPRDFYIKIGVALNYDNTPVKGASKIDYVIHTGLGWEF